MEYKVKEKEYILCSAIMYGGEMITGRRHSDCYRVLESLVNNPTLPTREDQGFLTSKNRFVDRKLAWKIAKQANQIKFGENASNTSKPELISENLYND